MKINNIYSFILLFLLIGLLSGCMDSDKRRQENLKAFAHAYGLVRWFHPSDEAQLIDWNQLAAYGVSCVERCQSTQELRDTLEALFHPIAPSVIFSKARQPEQIVSELRAAVNKAEIVSWQHFGVDLGLWSNYYTSKRTNRPLKTQNISKAVLYGSIPVDEYAGKQLTIQAHIRKLDGLDDYKIYLNLTDTEDAYLTYCADTTLQPLENEGEWKMHTYNIQVKDNQRNHAIYWSLYTEGAGAFAVDLIRLIDDSCSETIHTYLENNQLDQCKWNPVVYERFSLSRGIGFRTKTLLFDEQAPPGAYHSQQLTQKLYIHVPLAVESISNQTLPASDPGKLDALTERMASTSPSPRLLIIADQIVTWNVIKYFSPYLAEMKLDWEKELERALRLSSLSDSTYNSKPLKQLLAPLEDAHISVKTAANSEPKTLRVLPLSVRRLEDKLFIKHAFNPFLQPGDLIHAVNGSNAWNDFKQHESLISAAKHRRVVVAEQQWLYAYSSTAADSVTLVIERDHQHLAITVPLMDSFTYAQQLLSSYQPSGWLRPNLLYLNLATTDYKEVKHLLSHRESHQTVIVDIRRGSRFLFRQVVPLISMGADTLRQQNILSLTPTTAYPRTPIMDDPNTPISPIKANKRNLILIGGLNISNQEETLDYIRYASLGYLIGTPTGGCCGRINKIPLPSGGEVVFTGTKWLSHMGPDHYFYRVGITPDLYVDDRMDDLKEDKDVVLLKALEVAGY